MSLEVEEFPSLTNNNEDVSQTMESNSNQETNSDNEEETEPLTTEISKKKRIPPIIIDESVNTPALMDEICTLLGFKIMTRMVNGKLKVFPETIAMRIGKYRTLYQLKN
ncbi:hypothetical protein NPIL_70531 [Nephila pilipes]|uniref:Uncharacterized protein n=1 Tax=Nephila pilipes TaxID=299642 RepID=A0A8X6PRM4_NEPPI|nr:hypothetical protein NPIL_70531 [Nephila pilipes]